ncbi:MAG TPA: hypothetical protein VGX76_21395 [Pirellulales bacterium]|jgi:hypothetical protein|nr:hypothetical protein [Pirellulales bacterium]
MIVRLQILFDGPTADDKAALRSVARQLTNNRTNVRVFAQDDSSGWLVAEFSMPTAAQYKAVARIDRALRFDLENRVDSIISFPKEPGADRTPRRRRR